MKTIFTTIAIGLMMLSAKANHFSAFNLKMFDNGKFTVVLDDQPSFASNIFSAAKVQPGYHKLKVIRYYATPYGYSMMQKVVYKGWISIPAKSVVYAQINCHNQFDVVKIEPIFCPHSNGWGNNNGWNEEDDNDDYEYGYGTNCGYEGNSWGNPTAPQMPMCLPVPQAGISQMEFMQLKNSIANKSFESSKLEIAKQAIAQNNFTSAQIADLLTVFSFESSRVDFAKCAYGRVIDKQNYYLVNNAFSFESSIQELNQYIAGK